MSDFKYVINMLEKILKSEVPLLGFLNSLLSCFLDNYNFIYPNLIYDIANSLVVKN